MVNEIKFLLITFFIFLSSQEWHNYTFFGSTYMGTFKGAYDSVLLDFSRQNEAQLLYVFNDQDKKKFSGNFIDVNSYPPTVLNNISFESPVQRIKYFSEDVVLYGYSKIGDDVSSLLQVQNTQGQIKHDLEKYDLSGIGVINDIIYSLDGEILITSASIGTEIHVHSYDREWSVREILYTDKFKISDLKINISDLYIFAKYFKGGNDMVCAFDIDSGGLIGTYFNISGERIEHIDVVWDYLVSPSLLVVSQEIDGLMRVKVRVFDYVTGKLLYHDNRQSGTVIRSAFFLKDVSFYFVLLLKDEYNKEYIDFVDVDKSEIVQRIKVEDREHDYLSALAFDLSGDYFSVVSEFYGDYSLYTYHRKAD